MIGHWEYQGIRVAVIGRFGGMVHIQGSDETVLWVNAKLVHWRS